MKNLFTFLAIIFAFGTFTACSSDDDTPVVEASSTLKKELIGKWRVTHFYLEDRGIYVDITKPPFSEGIDENYFTFNNDDTFVGKGSLTSNQAGWFKDDAPRIYFYEDKSKTKGLAIITIFSDEPAFKEISLKIGNTSQKLKIRKQ